MDSTPLNFNEWIDGSQYQSHNNQAGESSAAANQVRSSICGDDTDSDTNSDAQYGSSDNNIDYSAAAVDIGDYHSTQSSDLSFPASYLVDPAATSRPQPTQDNQMSFPYPFASSHTVPYLPNNAGIWTQDIEAGGRVSSAQAPPLETVDPSQLQYTPNQIQGPDFEGAFDAIFTGSSYPPLTALAESMPPPRRSPNFSPPRIGVDYDFMSHGAPVLAESGEMQPPTVPAVRSESQSRRDASQSAGTGSAASSRPLSRRTSTGRGRSINATPRSESSRVNTLSRQPSSNRKRKITGNADRWEEAGADNPQSASLTLDTTREGTFINLTTGGLLEGPSTSAPASAKKPRIQTLHSTSSMPNLLPPQQVLDADTIIAQLIDTDPTTRGTVHSLMLEFDSTPKRICTMYTHHGGDLLALRASLKDEAEAFNMKYPTSS